MRKTLIQLLQELPPDQVVLTLLDGSPPRTAAMIIFELENDTDLGRQYATDLLRVVRDLLSRKARL